MDYEGYEPGDLGYPLDYGTPCLSSIDAVESETYYSPFANISFRIWYPDSQGYLKQLGVTATVQHGFTVENPIYYRGGIAFDFLTQSFYPALAKTYASSSSIEEIILGDSISYPSFSTYFDNLVDNSYAHLFDSYDSYDFYVLGTADSLLQYGSYSSLRYPAEASSTPWIYYNTVMDFPYIDFSDSGGGSTETYGVYNLKYIINGETATTQLLNINTTTYGGQEVTVSLSEDEKTINVTLDGNIISSYTSLDKKLKELTPTSFTILESETAQTITISATSYTEQPSFTGGVILDLYQSTAESNRLDKTKYLTSVGTLNGAFREETNVLNPSITIEYVGVPDFNYVYIPSLNRYYFVTNVTSIRYNVWQIDMSVDVLMTYKDAIIRCPAFIDRNENTYNDNIIDTRRVIEQGYDVEETTLTNELFDTANLTSDSFVLTGFAIKGV